MQTKQQIRQLLASAGVLPNRRLGQNFLIDLNLMRLLVNSANIQNNDVVLEAGCGTGSLTQALAERAGEVIAVELDRTLARIAEKQLKGKENVRVINADILENKNTINTAVTSKLLSARKKYSGRILLIANLPYSAASPLMLNLITPRTLVDGMHVTVQKEVAERMTAQVGSRRYGTLSIILEATGNIKTERILKPTVFWPEPQVDSTMVSFAPSREKNSRIRSLEIFSEVVNLFMGHRRKMLKSCTRFAAGSLSEIKAWPQILEQCFIDPTKRPEQITPEDYIALTNLCIQRIP